MHLHWNMWLLPCCAVCVGVHEEVLSRQQNPFGIVTQELESLIIDVIVCPSVNFSLMYTSKETTIKSLSRTLCLCGGL